MFLKVALRDEGLRAGAALLLFTAWTAHGQTYPAKPVRIIVPFTAGGASDVQTRTIGQKLTERWGQQVIADNRPGGTTVLATDLAAKSPPDGYTLLFVTTAFAINPSLRKVPYDILKNFDPVILLATAPNMLVAHPALPANSVRELVRLAKARPGEINYASAGSGTAAHVSMELLQIMGGIKLTHVPYKGVSQAFIDVMSGQVPLIITSPIAALPFVRQGKLKAISVSTSKRSAAAPDVPTVAESGIPNYEASGWQGIVAPAGVPEAIIQKLHADIDAVLRVPEIAKRFGDDGSEYSGAGPAAFRTHINREFLKWQKVVETSGARVD